MTDDLPTRYRNRVMSYLDSKGPLKPCNICGGTDWTVRYPVTLEPESFDVDGLPVTNRIVTQVVPVSCYKCGQVVFFDAVKAGIFTVVSGSLQYQATE